MKIRITGTKSECLAISNLFAEITENNKNIKCFEINGLYPNRNSKDVYRIYINVEYKEMNNDNTI